VRFWTAHEKPRASPVLVREGFSFGALVFGPFWLLAQGAWLPAIAGFLVGGAIPLLTRPPASAVLGSGLALLFGFSGRDLVRWTVARRGYLQTDVVTGRNEDEAYARLFTARPDLVERSMVAETAP
jgi:Protein of unknown function (DUF2628)